MSFDTGDTIEVTVGDVAQGGWCVARPDDGPVVFVRHALPGERVRARVTEVTSRLARAEAVEILNPSTERIMAPCPSARPGGCGGCDWQHATLPAQRALKAEVVTQQLRRLAGIERKVTVEPLPGDDGDPAPDSDNSNKRQPGLGWRTRVQFAVGPDGRAGLRAHRSHEVIDVGDCLIAHPAIRDLGVPRLPWPDAESVEAIVGSGDAAGPERAVIVTPRAASPVSQSRAASRSPRQAEGDPGHGAARAGARRDPRRADGRRRLPAEPGGSGTGAIIRSGEERTDGVPAVAADAVLSRAGRRLSPVRGRTYLRQRAGGREWRVSAGAFWQVHPAAADTLIAAVLAMLEPEPGDAVLDLYCGAGLFAGAVAPLVGPAGAVMGIEADEAAVRDARHNLRDIGWARVHRGDVAQVLRRGGGAGSRAGGPLASARLAVADPPRAGLARSVIDDLSAGATERFAYVSCDPATLARDLGLLLARGWRLEDLRAFDAFPMTHHTECVASLAR